jgi:hypothetical protein
LRDPKQVASGLVVQVGQIRRMIVGNNEEMAWIDRLNIQKRRTTIIVVDEVGRRPSRNNGAEDAIAHSLFPVLV